MPGQAFIEMSTDVKVKTWGAIKLKVLCDHLHELMIIDCMLQGEYTAQDRLIGGLRREREMRRVTKLSDGI
jgi:hypothetical protein